MNLKKEFLNKPTLIYLGKPLNNYAKVFLESKYSVRSKKLKNNCYPI